MPGTSDFDFVSATFKHTDALGVVRTAVIERTADHTLGATITGEDLKHGQAIYADPHADNPTVSFCVAILNALGRKVDRDTVEGMRRVFNMM